MKHYVTVRAGNSDSFSVGQLPQDDREIIVPLEQPSNPRRIGTNVWNVFDSARLNPSGICIDLLRAAIAVYSIDLRIGRYHGFDNWTRELVLNLPVSDVTIWSGALPTLQTLLRFLTGDRWTINIRPQVEGRPSPVKRFWDKGASPEVDAVTLFSGGLDSFIGAVELTSNLSDACLVGHYDDGTTSSTQDSLLQCFRTSRQSLSLPFLKFRVEPPKKLTGEEEPSKRSRSFLFLTLGTVVAATLHQPGTLRVAENGFIGINAPLIITRLGSLSTRTTHPHTFELFKRLLEMLKINVNIETPYMHMTKGEMIQRVISDTAFNACYKITLSCAHPQATRYLGMSPNTHCGYCVPCIIRRAAFSHVGLDPADTYAVNILPRSPAKRKSHDLRAFLAAIETHHPARAIRAILSSGPISAEPTLIAQYAAVYNRGLEEVNQFLARRRWRRLPLR